MHASCGFYQGNFFVWDEFFTEYASSLEDILVGFIDLTVVRCVLCGGKSSVPKDEDDERFHDTATIDRELTLHLWEDYEHKINIFMLGYPGRQEAVRGVARGEISELFICKDCMDTFKDEIDGERLRIEEELILQTRESLAVCLICNKNSRENQGLKFVTHHTSYQPEKTMAVCATCHAKIHHSNKYREFKPEGGARARARRQKREDKRIKREKAEADKWRENYYRMQAKKKEET